MSGRKCKKIKPINLDEQPQIRQFILDNQSTTPNSENPTKKKRRRSTGEGITSSKRRNSIPDLLPRQDITFSETDSDCELAEKMASTNMLEEIKKMEERLSKKITENKDQEIAQMEECLNNNIKTTIDNSIREALQTMQTSICTAVQNNPVIHSHSVEITGLKAENLRLTRKVQQLHTEQSRMKKQLNRIETKNLECSLIVRGLPEEFKETKQMIIDKLHCILTSIMHGDTDEIKLANAKQIIIRSARRLGRYNKNQKRPVAIELQHRHDIEYILENRFDLERGIFVDKEYPTEIERKRRTLLPILKAAKRLSDYKKGSRLEEDRLILKGRPYTVNTLSQLPDELNVFSVTSKENEHCVGYFGEINPLSNFFPAPFQLDGIRYISSEQFIQSTKAKFFGDLDTYNQLLCVSTSHECKELSRQIRNVVEEKWTERAGELCFPGIRAKFLQNPYCMDTLITKTSSKRIMECTSDKLWGNGSPLQDPNCLDPSQPQGIMGEMLESIRSEILLTRFRSTTSQQRAWDLTRPEPSATATLQNDTSDFHVPIHGATLTNPQPILFHRGNMQQTDDSNPSSASTTPVSDTTATETDQSETMAEDSVQQMIIDKLHCILTSIMHGDTDEIKLANAKQIIIRSARRLGRYNKNRKRPVAIELQHRHDIEYILENRFDLERGIFVDKEYPTEIERKRRTLLPILKAAKRLSDYKKGSRLEEDRLILKERPYTVNTLSQLPDELNVFSVTSKENEHCVGYFGEINPLSNFFPAPFQLDGIRYISSEQFIQSTKAKFFGDLDTYNQLLCMSTSHECKELSRQIRNVVEEKWTERAGELCFPGIRAKFLQNPYCMDTLITKTSSKRIMECTSDKLWGNGSPLQDPNCLDPSQPQGIMGEMLESIRSEILLTRFRSTTSQQRAWDLTRPEPSATATLQNDTSDFHVPIHGATLTNPQPILFHRGNMQQTDDSNPSSASTTPVSDTTATETDRSETMAEDSVQQDPVASHNEQSAE